MIKHHPADIATSGDACADLCAGEVWGAGAVTRAQHQRVRRYAAVVALAKKVASPLIDTERER
jgi:hypothetical protein